MAGISAIAASVNGYRYRVARSDPPRCIPHQLHKALHRKFLIFQLVVRLPRNNPQHAVLGDEVRLPPRHHFVSLGRKARRVHHIEPQGNPARRLVDVIDYLIRGLPPDSGKISIVPASFQRTYDTLLLTLVNSCLPGFRLTVKMHYRDDQQSIASDLINNSVRETLRSATSGSL